MVTGVLGGCVKSVEGSGLVLSPVLAVVAEVIDGDELEDEDTELLGVIVCVEI